MNPFKFSINKNNNSKIEESNNVQKFKKYNLTRPSNTHYTICQAPFNNLYFTRTGKVATCCFNQEYSLGEYPEKSIKKIWGGEAIQKLRNTLQKYDLSLGCQACKYFMDANNPGESNSLRFDEYQTKELPISLEFQLSNTCNLSCVMCNGHFSSTIRKNIDKLPPLEDVYDVNFVEELKPLIPNLKETTFSGGEPFLIDLYYSIWEQITFINPLCSIKVITNGTVLNHKVKELLNKGKFHITVSLDSTSKQNYENIRVGANYDRVIENAEWFMQYCKSHDTSFNFNFCPMTTNYHEIADFVELCNNYDVTFYFNKVYFPSKFALERLDDIEIKTLYDKLEAVQFNQDKNIQQRNQTTLQRFISDLKRDYKNSTATALEAYNYAVIIKSFEARIKSILIREHKTHELGNINIISKRFEKLDFSKINMDSFSNFINQMNYDYYMYFNSFDNETFNHMMYRYFGK